MSINVCPLMSNDLTQNILVAVDYKWHLVLPRICLATGARVKRKPKGRWRHGQEIIMSSIVRRRSYEISTAIAVGPIFYPVFHVNSSLSMLIRVHPIIFCRLTRTWIRAEPHKCSQSPITFHSRNNLSQFAVWPSNSGIYTLLIAVSTN